MEIVSRFIDGMTLSVCASITGKVFSHLAPESSERSCTTL